MLMNEDHEMVTKNNSSGLYELICDCDALDELEHAERSSVAAFGATTVQ